MYGLYGSAAAAAVDAKLTGASHHLHKLDDRAKTLIFSFSSTTVTPTGKLNSPLIPDVPRPVGRIQPGSERPELVRDFGKILLLYINTIYYIVCFQRFAIDRGPLKRPVRKTRPSSLRSAFRASYVFYPVAISMWIP